MSEYLSGSRPDDMYGEDLPSNDNGNRDIEEAYQQLSLEELEQIRESAAAIIADIEVGSWPFTTPSPKEAIPILFTEGECDEAPSPIWGTELLVEQLLPEEAPTLLQREHARSYYLTLISLADKRYHDDETFPEPREIIEAYTAYRVAVEAENQSKAPADRLPDFTLTHLWAAARRQNLWVMRWLQDQRAYEAPEQYQEALFLLLLLENGIAEAARGSLE